MHPAARILLVCGWAGALELAAPPALALCALAVLPVLLWAPACATVVRLLRRSRWLFLILFLTYAWTLPGAGVWPALGVYGPTFPGLEAGGLRVARLALMLAGVAVLLSTTPVPRLVYGLYTLARPFGRFGFDARAFAVRLGLTLDATQGALGDWRARLAGTDPDPGQPTVFTLAIERWRWRDSFALLAAAGLLAAGA